MTTRSISIFGPNTMPDSSGNTWFEPYAIKATNDFWNMLVAIFANAGSAKIKMGGQFTVPQDYVGTASFVFTWTAQTTSGNVVWGIEYRNVAGDDANSLDQATAQETLSVTDVAPGATDRRMTPSLSATSANFAAGNTVEFNLYRDKSSGSDTLAAAVTLVDILFQYSDT